MLLRLGDITKGRRYRLMECLVMPDGGIAISLITAPAPIVPFPQDVVGPNNQPQVISSIGMPVWDLQLETETGDVEDAGTDDKVQLLLTGEDEPFYLDHVFDDRKRGGIDRYNVAFPNLRDCPRRPSCGLAAAGGLGGWLVCQTRGPVCEWRSDTTLYTHLRVLFLDHFDGSDQTPLTVNSDELRADAQWSLLGHGSNLLRPPTLLTPDHLKNRVEHAMGDRLSSDYGDTWDDCDNRSCIQVDRGSGRSFVASLKYKTVNSLNPDDYYNINFDFGFRCVSGELKVKPRNFGGSFFFRRDRYDRQFGHLDERDGRFGQNAGKHHDQPSLHRRAPGDRLRPRVPPRGRQDKATRRSASKTIGSMSQASCTERPFTVRPDSPIWPIRHSAIALAQRGSAPGGVSPVLTGSAHDTSDDFLAFLTQVRRHSGARAGDAHHPRQPRHP